MLFWKELKKIIWSVPYFLFVCAVTLALFSQGVLDFSGDKVLPPKAGENYGSKNVEIPEIIMPAALDSLYAEFIANNYRTYPIGFIKNVKLDDDEQMEIAKIISSITGVDTQKIYATQEIADQDKNRYFDIEDPNVQTDGNGNFVITADEHTAQSSGQEEGIQLFVKDDMQYSRFTELMQRVDDILGGGSSYAAKSLIGFGTVAVTYEEAVQRYGLFLSRDKITGGYARLFSDYAVAIGLSILPVFLAVIMEMKDRASEMSDLIYTRRVTGRKIIFVRFAALVTAAMLPVILLSYISNASVWGMYEGMALDYLAPLKYDFGWILPSVMIATAVGMCLTEFTNTPIAVAVQGLWWFMDINRGMESVAASCSLFRLAPRHNAGTNSYFRTEDYIGNFAALFTNRLLFVGGSILLVAVTVVIYEAKRKGQLNGKIKIKRTCTIMGNCKNQSQA